MALTRRGRVVVVLAIFGTIVAIPALAGGWYLTSIGLWGDSRPGRAVEIVIPKGATVEEIGALLEEKGVVKSALGFRLASNLEEGAEDIQAGRYELPTGLTAGDALQILLDEKPAGEEFVTVTFPEGSWVTDFAAEVGRSTHISSKEFLEVATSGEIRSEYQPEDVRSLEGLLFPSTYQVIKKDGARSLVERLVAEFEEQVAGLDFAGARATGVSPYEAIIVASMIEAETSVESEGPKVARVIYNRLNEGMPLGIDATVIYALGEHKTSLTESDLAIDSPYNTRKVMGLPPTPIGSPSLASIEAALEPADGDWLYYVLHDCDGNHAFSVDYDQFLADKAVYQSLEC